MDKLKFLLLLPIVEVHKKLIAIIVKTAIKKPLKFLKYFYAFVIFGLLGWVLFFLS